MRVSVLSLLLLSFFPGTRAFNWSGILGSIARSSPSNAYYPEGNRGVGATFSRVGMSIPFSMIDELFNEFGPNLQKKLFGKNGSAQEFVETRILGCFLKSDEFGLGDRHALGLEQQVDEILVASTPSKKSFDVAVDGFHHAERYFSAAVIEDAVQVIQQHEGELLEGCQPLPA